MHLEAEAGGSLEPRSWVPRQCAEIIKLRHSVSVWFMVRRLVQSVSLIQVPMVNKCFLFWGWKLLNQFRISSYCQVPVLWLPQAIGMGREINIRICEAL